MIEAIQQFITEFLNKFWAPPSGGGGGITWSLDVGSLDVCGEGGVRNEKMSKITKRIRYEASNKALYDDIDKIIEEKTPKEMSTYAESTWKVGVYCVLVVAMLVMLILSEEMILVPLWAIVLAFLFFTFAIVDQSWIAYVLKYYLKKLGEEK